MSVLPVLLAASIPVLASAPAPQAGAMSGVLADAVRHFQAQELEIAEALLLDVREVLPENAEAAFYLGRVYLERGEAEAAVEALAEAARLDPESSPHQFWLAEALVARIHEVPVLFKLPIANRMRTAYEKAVELDPENLDARAAVARYHLQAPPVAGGNPVLADEQIEEIRRLDPALAQVLIDERDGRRPPLSATGEAESVAADVMVGPTFCHGF